MSPIDWVRLFEWYLVFAALHQIGGARGVVTHGGSHSDKLATLVFIPIGHMARLGGGIALGCAVRTGTAIAVRNSIANNCAAEHSPGNPSIGVVPVTATIVTAVISTIMPTMTPIVAPAMVPAAIAAAASAVSTIMFAAVTPAAVSTAVSASMSAPTSTFTGECIRGHHGHGKSDDGQTGGCLFQVCQNL